MNASVFQLAFVDVRCGVFENKFVSPDVPSSIHNRITSNFESIDFECENIQRNKRSTGEPSIKNDYLFLAFAYIKNRHWKIL